MKGKLVLFVTIFVLLLLVGLVGGCIDQILGPYGGGSCYGIVGNSSAYTVRIVFVNYFSVDLPVGTNVDYYLAEGTYSYEVYWLTKDGPVLTKSGKFTVNGKTNDAHYGSTYCDWAFVYNSYYRS